MEDTPFQRVDALCLRRVIRLGFGDFEAAERLRREAELVAVRHGVKLMFSSYLYVELTTHALVRDLSGVRHVAGQIASFAERYPGWLKFHYLAQGQLELLRGDMQAAKHWLERGLALCAAETTDPQRSPNAWPHACGAYMRALIGSGEFAEARALGEQSLREFAALDIENTEEVQQALALAETKLGDYDSAVQRLDRLISSQRALGVVGLHLGASFEARARAAIWAKDAKGFAQFVRLTAHEYRHGHAAGLQARCERLREEAQRGGLEPPDPDAALLQVAPIALQSEPSITQIIECALEAAETPEQRAAAVLRVLCETAGVEAGHLYLVQTDASLRWVASRALSEPTERERERAARHFEHVRSRGVGATMVSSAREARVSAVKTSPSLRTPGLMREQVLLLTAATGQELRHVAVAVLNNGERTALMEAEHPILSHLGARLSKSGDVSGIAVYGKGGRA
jgi:tetratricopeptide (TPR) repeat protein